MFLASGTNPDTPLPSQPLNPLLLDLRPQARMVMSLTWKKMMRILMI